MGQSSSAVKTSSRKETPTHYVLKVDNFSSVVQSVSQHTSRVFEASGYKWQLILYPRQLQIQLVVISEIDTNTQPPGWEINAMLTFFVYNHHKDKYVTYQYRKLCRFNAINRSWGVGIPIDYGSFTSPCNGYLKNGSCMFGVEVFVAKNHGQGEILTMKKEPSFIPLPWKIGKFSQLKDQIYDSPNSFSCGGYQWKLKFYPNGNGEWQGKSVSLFLTLQNTQNLPTGQKVGLNFKLRIRNQVSDKHKEFTSGSGTCFFTAEEPSWGWRNFLKLDDLNTPKNGYVIEDALIAEVEFIDFLPVSSVVIDLQ